MPKHDAQPFAASHAALEPEILAMSQHGSEPRSTTSLKRWLPLLMIVAVMALVFVMGWHRHITFENLALRRDELRGFVAGNTLLAVLAFMLTYIVVVVLSLPGAGVLTITGGVLFGLALGVPATIVAATIGATLIFLIARTSLGAALAERAGPWLDQFRKGFEEEGLSYMLFLRLIPLPFFIVNLAPAVLGVPLRTFVIGTFFGIIPGTIAFNYLGYALDQIIVQAKASYDACIAAKGAAQCTLTIELGMLPFRQILIALSLIGVMALVPTLVKKWRARNATV